MHACMCKVRSVTQSIFFLWQEEMASIKRMMGVWEFGGHLDPGPGLVWPWQDKTLFQVERACKCRGRKQRAREEAWTGMSMV